MSELEDVRARLRLGQQPLAISLDHAPIGMSIVDNDDRLARVNDALCRSPGHSPSELLGRSWEDLTHPADPTVGAAEIAALFAGERASFAVEKRYLRADGQHVDIRARRELEQQLRQLADAERAVADRLRRLDEIENDFPDAEQVDAVTTIGHVGEASSGTATARPRASRATWWGRWRAGGSPGNHEDQALGLCRTRP